MVFGKERLVVWGLRGRRHTHSHIHSGFFSAAQSLGLECIWLGDNQNSKNQLQSNDVVLASNPASKYLPKRTDLKYVLHNMDDWASGLNASQFINLQVFSKSASGHELDTRFTLWNEETQTLFQPWETPLSPDKWLEPRTIDSREEYWIGSVWNNEHGQGNAAELTAYRAALDTRGISLKVPRNRLRFCLTRPVIRFEGPNELEARDLISASRLGSSIVGDWQKTNQYLPCRLFKNLSAGQPVSSNADFSNLFVDAIHDDSIADLVHRRLNLSRDEILELVWVQQQDLENYTYSANLERISTCMKSI